MESPLTVSDKTCGTLTFFTVLHGELQHASTDGYCISCTNTSPKRQPGSLFTHRNAIAASLADASG